jgi:hypothetical protein
MAGNVKTKNHFHGLMNVLLASHPTHHRTTLYHRCHFFGVCLPSVTHGEQSQRLERARPTKTSPLRCRAITSQFSVASQREMATFTWATAPDDILRLLLGLCDPISCIQLLRTCSRYNAFINKEKKILAASLGLPAGKEQDEAALRTGLVTYANLAYVRLPNTLLIFF